ncbi:ABC transporter permease [Desulforudis sp. 1088]|uniref:ABC transporter permease n=1 Tax=unclassified Candidatus Desulforudis TaxID=2635950 RepID=UPI003CE5B0A2
MIQQLAAFLFLLGLWHVTALLLHIEQVPTPLEALVVLTKGLQGELGGHILASTARVLASILISFAVAVPLGLFLGREERWDRYAAPLIYIVYPIPKIVFLPIIFLVDFGDGAKIFLISLVIVFQILVTARDAARKIDRAVVDSMLSLGAGKIALYRHVVWPAALPEIFTALRISSGTAIAVLFFSETICGTNGLGYYILDAWSSWLWPNMWAGVVAMGLLGYVLYTAIDQLERRVCAWKHL